MGERRQPADGVGVQRLDAFSQFIHGVKEVFVLFLESFVQREEVLTLDVPVREVVSDINW